MLTYWLKIA